MLAYDANYNLVLEDDVKPAKHALHKAHEFAIMLENRTDWGFLTFYSGVRRNNFVTDLRGKQYSGACSWLFRYKTARKVLRVLSVEAQKSPVDMIIPHYVQDVLGLTVYERTPNLFQHASLKSTYTGQVSGVPICTSISCLTQFTVSVNITKCKRIKHYVSEFQKRNHFPL